MQNLPGMLSAIDLKLEQLLLDPNNPRFSELGEVLNSISEGRFADEKVQASTFDKMKDPSFDVAELRDTIKAIGFLPMDRIVVRRWKGKSVKELFVVIEGNRRATALKWLVDLHGVGKINFDDVQLINLTNLECLLLDDKHAMSAANLILPGLRHVSGIKEWGPYQKAKAVHALRDSGLSPQEAAQSLGLSTRAANASYRCFVALEQMVADEEFGEYAEPRMYSYFEEIFKRPDVRNWLAWDNEKEQFCNKDRLSEFYAWMLPSGENGNETPKLPEAKSVRDLSGIVNDESALNVLRTPEGSLSRALARYQVDHPEDWYPKVLAAEAALKSLTPDMLRKLDDTTLSGLEQLQARIQQALTDRKKLTQGK